MLSKAGLFAYGRAENVERGTLFPHMTVLEHRRLGRRVARATASQPWWLRCTTVADKHAMLSTARRPTPSCPPGGQLHARAARCACQAPLALPVPAGAAPPASLAQRAPLLHHCGPAATGGRARAAAARARASDNALSSTFGSTFSEQRHWRLGRWCLMCQPACYLVLPSGHLS